MDNDQRKSWQYQVPAGLRTFVDLGDGKWRQDFPNGTSQAMKEHARTAEYVELENEAERNRLRLFDDHAEVKRADESAFKRFASGRWLTEPATWAPAPVENAKTIAATADYLVHLVYFVPNDRQPVNDYELKLHWLARMMESVFDKDFRQKGMTVTGPRFARLDDKVEVILLRGEMSASEYSQNFAWKSNAHGDAIFREVDRRLGNSKERMTLVFCDTYADGPAEKLWPGHIALAIAKPPRGGIACFSGWILRDEFASTDPRELQQRFFDATPITGRSALGDDSTNSPRADFMEDGVGGAIHELAHMFGLTHHSQRNADRHIMAQGFRNLRWNVGLRDDRVRGAMFSPEHAQIMNASRFINKEVDRTDNEPPKATASARRMGRNAVVSMEATDDRGLRIMSVIEKSPRLGRELLWSQVVDGHECKLTASVTLMSGTSEGVELDVIAIDVGGNFRTTDVAWEP